MKTKEECKIEMNELWPFLAIFIIVTFADIAMSFTGHGIFSVSRAIQLYGLRELFFPVSLFF